MFYLKLVIQIILAPLMTVGIYLSGKKTRIKDVKLVRREIIAGLVFALGSVLLTHLSIPLGDALISTRDSAVLSASLIFGPVAGLTASTIASLERFFSSGAHFTALGASITTFLIGCVGALLRYYMFDNRKPSWPYAFSVAFSMEVVNMLFVFLTNMDDVRSAFITVEKVALPMILANSISAGLSLYIVTTVSGERREVKKRRKNSLLLSQVFARWLFSVVILSFIISWLFIYVLQTRLMKSDAEEMLSLYISDVSDDISDASDENLLSIVRSVRRDIVEKGTYGVSYLNFLANKYDVSEINIIDSSGIIVSSTNYLYTGFDMAQGLQSREFLSLLSGEGESLVQRYQKVSHSSGVDMKYAAGVFPSGGFVQVGYNARRFQEDIASLVVGLTNNRHVGESGTMLIADSSLTIVSDTKGNDGRTLIDVGIEIDEGKENTLIRESVYGEDSYMMYAMTEGYYIIGVIPLEEVVFGRNISLYVTLFIEIMVFSLLFLLIYFLLKKLIVDNIQKINASLEEITGGNLSVSVDVRSNCEFISLSDDINSTVDTLKGYIKEAAARIDKELEAARTIQLSSLPSIFPPYPGRKDFDIYAQMFTAREVGGDFYDFYLLEDGRLLFLIADVSGKGISAALFMMRAKSILKSLSERSSSIESLMEEANGALCENNEAGMFVTCWLGIYDFPTHVVEFVNAGHNPPLLRHRGGEWEYLKARSGFILAGMEGTKYRKGEFMLLPGDEIFLYTDGVTEAADRGGNLYGEERLLSSLSKLGNSLAEEICHSVKEDVDLFTLGAEQADDITMISLRILQ